MAGVVTHTLSTPTGVDSSSSAQSTSSSTSASSTSLITPSSSSSSVNSTSTSPGTVIGDIATSSVSSSISTSSASVSSSSVSSQSSPGVIGLVEPSSTTVTTPPATPSVVVVPSPESHSIISFTWDHDSSISSHSAESTASTSLTSASSRPALVVLSTPSSSASSSSRSASQDALTDTHTPLNLPSSSSSSLTSKSKTSDVTFSKPRTSSVSFLSGHPSPSLAPELDGVTAQTLQTISSSSASTLPLMTGVTSSSSLDESHSTFVSNGVTLTGSAAVAAALAATGSTSSGASVEAANSGSKEGGGSKLSSLAIIGIVGGILVLFVLIYIGWFQWRKKKTSKKSDEDLGVDGYDEEGNPVYREKRYDQSGNPIHSGYDFSDDPVSAGLSRRSRRNRSRRSRGEDPFDDTRGSDYGATWYQDPFEERPPDDNGLEEELANEHDYAGEGEEGTRHFDDMDDGMTTALGDNLKTGFGSTIYGDQLGAGSPPPPLPAVPSEYGNKNRSSGQLSTSHTIPKRPPTAHSQAETFNIGEFYGDDPSRPGTHYDPAVMDDTQRASTLYEPSTSSLLPWLDHNKSKPQTPAPPVPPIPAHIEQAGRKSEVDPWTSRGQAHVTPTNTGKQKGKRRDSFVPLDEGSDAPRPGQIMRPQQGSEGRAPPAPVMARTPMVGNTGWQGVVPPFR